MNLILSISSYDECICYLFNSISIPLPLKHFICYRSSECFGKYAGCKDPTKLCNFRNWHRNSFRRPCPNRMGRSLIERLDFLYEGFLLPTNGRCHLLKCRFGSSSSTLVFAWGLITWWSCAVFFYNVSQCLFSWHSRAS